MMSLRNISAPLLLVAMATAFAPVKNRPAAFAATRTEALQFGFLKDLGLEKPDWLPDFGGKKEEAKKPNVEEEITTEEEAAPVEEE
jgi:hypothetical protein